MLFSPWADVISSEREGLPAQGLGLIACLLTRARRFPAQTINWMALLSLVLFASPSKRSGATSSVAVIYGEPHFISKSGMFKQVSCSSEPLHLSSSPQGERVTSMNHPPKKRGRKKSAGLQLKCVSSAKTSGSVKACHSQRAAPDSRDVQKFVGIRGELVKQNHDPPKLRDPLNNFPPPGCASGPADGGQLPAQSGFALVCI